MQFFQRWHKTPLYIRIVIALVVGLAIGVSLKSRPDILETLRVPSDLILRMLRTLAPPLILIAVIRALMHAELKGAQVRKMVGLLVVNTVVAIIIGLIVANTIQPGRWGDKVKAPEKKTETHVFKADVLKVLKEENYKPEPKPAKDPLMQFLDNVPRTLLEPLVASDKVLGVIFIALAFGIALRPYKDKRIQTLADIVDIAFEALIRVLHWIIDVVPLGILGIVAHLVGTKGLEPFKSLGFFILAVILGLTLQGGYYLLRVRLQSWVRPIYLLQGMRDALLMAFSTASSTATMPITYECLKERVKVREESASMGALVGSNFNNEGTALYEAMAALFVAQLLGLSLSLPQQLVVVLTSIIASVGAAGIPEAGLVTLTLVLTSVHLPADFIPVIFSVDWFLDRCRTTINVMGDVTVSCVHDGKTPENRLSEAEPEGA